MSKYVDKSYDFLDRYDVAYLKGLAREVKESRAELTELVNVIEYKIALKDINQEKMDNEQMFKLR